MCLSTFRRPSCVLSGHPPSGDGGDRKREMGGGGAEGLTTVTLGTLGHHTRVDETETARTAGNSEYSIAGLRAEGSSPESYSRQPRS